MLRVITTLLFALLFVGCGGVKPVSNEAISQKIQKQNSMMDILDEEAEDIIDQSENEQELYFLDTKGKVFYSGVSSAKTDIGYRVELLLNDLFFSAKASLPRKSRREKLYISVVVGKKSFKRTEILDASQEYILSHRRYALANTDSQSMRVLKKVLQQEKDGIYKHRTSAKLRASSDVVLYVSAKQKKDKELYLKAKLISKNGEILAQATTRINLSEHKNQQWAEVKVPRNDAPAQLFEVMVKPVTQKEFYGTGKDVAVTNISYTQANKYCKNKLNAELLHPYVFEYARRSLVLQRPSSSVSTEMIAPYDEEDHEMYYQDGDNLEAEDGTIVLFDWNSEKYFVISNLYRSANTTFRCMRSK